ncbi:MAG TPA: hydrogenase maturation protease [Symbiobacteriaceae bacterium]|jgi:hydrogenase maturation protease|nr:hydrogenase maturation protease [Symbiobacteriaceae bacterium]
MRTEKNPVLVLGIGNTLFTDDGAGVYAVRVAKRLWRGEGVDFEEAQVGGFELVHYIVGRRAVLIVDAAVTGLAEPGAISAVNVDALPPTFTVRGWGAGLGTALNVARSMRLPLPDAIQFLMIEAQDISCVGEIPTTPVADAIRPAAQEVLRITTELVDGVLVMG